MTYFIRTAKLSIIFLGKNRKVFKTKQKKQYVVLRMVLYFGVFLNVVKAFKEDACKITQYSI